MLVEGTLIPLLVLLEGTLIPLLVLLEGTLIPLLVLVEGTLIPLLVLVEGTLIPLLVLVEGTVSGGGAALGGTKHLTLQPVSHTIEEVLVRFPQAMDLREQIHEMLW